MLWHIMIMLTYGTLFPQQAFNPTMVNWTTLVIGSAPRLLNPDTKVMRKQLGFYKCIFLSNRQMDSVIGLYFTNPL